MKKPFHYFLFLIFLLVALSGCSAPLTENDRLACLELSSYSAISVPSCITPEKCYAAVDNAFPIKGNFSSPVHEEILRAKNHLSRAWLFMNKSKDNLKIINSQCYTSKDLSLAVRNANELNSNLSVATSEIDLFNASAIKALNYELDVLELEDINQIREDALFDDYIILNQNINDFSSNNKTSETYASRFLKHTGTLSSISKKLSLQQTLPETSLFDLIAENSRLISNELVKENAKKRDFPIAFISPIFSGISGFIADYLSIGGTVSSLRNIPSADVFSALNGIIGSDNSAASAFFSTFANDSKNRETLVAKISSEKQKLTSDFQLTEEKIDSLSVSLNPDYLNALLLPSDTISGLTESPFPVSDYDSTFLSFREKLSNLRYRLMLLNESDYLNSSTLGSSSSELKKISAELISLNSKLDSLSKSADYFSLNCGQKLSAIKNSLIQESFSPISLESAVLKEKIRAEISDFESTQNMEYCSSAIIGFSSLKELLDSEIPGVKTDSLIAVCISESEAMAKFDSSGVAEARLKSLKRIETPYENPLLVLETCAEIKAGLDEGFRGNNGVQFVSENFANLTQRIFLLRGIMSSYSLKSAKAEKALNTYGLLSENFEIIGSSPLFVPESYEKISSVRQSTLSLLEGTESLLKELAAEAVSKNYTVEYYHSGTDNPYYDYSAFPAAKIEFTNLLEEIPFPFVAPISFDSSHAKEVFSTPNLSFSSKGSGTELNFSGLIPGKNFIVLDANYLLRESAALAPLSSNSSSLNALKDDVLSKKEELLKRAKTLGDKDLLSVYGERISAFSENGLFEEAEKENQRMEATILGLESVQEKTLSEKEFAQELTEKLKGLDSAKKSLVSQLVVFDEMFAGLSKEELEKASAFSPISPTQLSNFKTLSSASLPLSVSAAEEMFKEGSYSGLIHLLDSEAFNSLYANIFSADKEVSQALNSLKQKAVSSYNYAADRVSSESSGELLLLSRKELEEKSYLKSILHSYESINPPAPILVAGNFDIPIPVYPLIVIILGVGIYVYRKSNLKVEEKAKKIKKSESDEEN